MIAISVTLTAWKIVEITGVITAIAGSVTAIAGAIQAVETAKKQKLENQGKKNGTRRQHKTN